MDVFRAKLGTGIDDNGSVYLRPLLPEDITERYIEWFQDQRVIQFLESKCISGGEAIQHLVHGFVKDKWYMYAVIDRARNLHIGNIKLGPINRKHQTATISIVLGSVDSWGHGFATRAISLATRIAFEQLGLRKLQAGVIAGNVASLQAFQKAGWAIEAELPHDLLHEGKVKSRFMLGILNTTHPENVDIETRAS